MPFLKTQTQSFRWLFAELLVVVLGILIALSTSSWYDNYQKRQQEQKILNQLAVSLDLLLPQLQSRLDQYLSVQSVSQEFLESLNSNVLDAELFNDGITALYNWSAGEWDFAIYEDLKSKGLDLIVDDNLRYDLINFYEIHYPNIESMSLREREIVTNHIMPLLHRITERESLSNPLVKPVNYEELRMNTELRNLIYEKAGRTGIFISNTERTVNAASDLINSINAEIN